MFRPFHWSLTNCRSGQMLNLHDIAGDVGVSDDTAKRRMKELEKCDTRELPRKNISASYSAFAGLYFIEDNKRFIWQNTLSCFRFKIFYQL